MKKILKKIMKIQQEKKEGKKTTKWTYTETSWKWKTLKSTHPL